MGMSWVYSAAERDDAESVRVIHRALELGITFFDTADLYGPFLNEQLVGRALAGHRDEVVLASKCGLVPDMDLYPETVKVTPNGRPEHVRASCEGSLTRLGVDHLDLYQLHRVDPEVPVEESWGAMSELVRAGKVRHLGLSEATVEHLERASAVHPVATLQSEMSLWSREPMADVLPWCLANGVGFVPFSPLGRGFLTGAIRRADQLPTSDFRAQMPRFAEGALETNLRIVEIVQEGRGPPRQHSRAGRAGLVAGPGRHRRAHPGQHPPAAHRGQRASGRPPARPRGHGRPRRRAPGRRHQV
jgi:aryl-alcohol dehydrogenase-like predicted oxidoreductase